MTGHHVLHARLDVEVEEQGDRAVILISGACDASCHDQLRRQLAAAEASGAREIVVDLTCLGFIDSVGLSLLVAAWNRARHAGHSFSVVLAGSGEVRRVFELTGVDHVVPMAGAPA